ncbi:ornithine carbamoyltransferase [Propionibacteriaceae bacterium Y1923]|uniref:ornithine carbamoyltransferase n=1 Tax=Aestuariimicrobium sp. Y1814 TaxID=3418742 RepID=UPI003C218862
MTSLTGRSFLKELDFTPDEWRSLLDLAAQLKQERRDGVEQQRLLGRTIALIFEKSSSRTRSAFEVAAAHQGAHTTYFDPTGSHIRGKESIVDTALLFGRMFDAIEYRGFGQDTVEQLAEHSGVPVWNGLTDEWHPTQTLADQLTIREWVDKPLDEVTIAYLGDARNNVGNSVLAAGALMGMDVRMVAPTQLHNTDEVVAQARAVAEQTGARITLTDDVAAGVAGADVIYTDVWVSMGEPKEVWTERINLLTPYQVNAAVMDATGNPDVIAMHCLPAYHDRNTTVGEEVYQLTGMEALEITDEVFQAQREVIFDQAENRMHTIKAVMVATLARN